MDMSVATTSSCSSIMITLEENDIEGAHLEEPLESKTMHQLRWWLLCHGQDAPRNVKKVHLIERVRKAKSEKTEVIDIDGTYLEKKRQRLLAANVKVAPLPRPAFPPHGWQNVDETNAAEVAIHMPCVLPTTLYTYLAEGVGNAKGSKAFRALTRGYVHWSSRRINKMEVHTLHPLYAFARCSIIPSMRAGSYNVTILLKREAVHGQDIGRIEQATCECAAGLSASCVHVSALLHALVALKPAERSHPLSDDDSDEDAVPVTSLPCRWKQPKKRKSNAMEISTAKFEKYEYGKVKKQTSQFLETFDPRPEELRNQGSSKLPHLLSALAGKGLCVSLLLDPSTRVEVPQAPKLTRDELLKKVDEFVSSKLSVTAEKARQIEVQTREQSKSQMWYEARRLRLTASLFGRVRQLKPTTSPDNLVLTILGVKKLHGKALQYGMEMEKVALEEYVKHQKRNGHDYLLASPSGLIVSQTHPYLGATPDACVHDPSVQDEPFGFAEIKCSYKYRDTTPDDAALNSDFMLHKDVDGSLKLKRNHVYYSQIQGQMAIGDRNWCDFVVFTNKGISIERIPFNSTFWESELLPKLTEFYTLCVAPEIVCPQHPVGLPIRDLRRKL